MPTYESTGTLTTITKSFSNPQKPDLSGLTYTLNGGSVQADVVGSPGTASEEIVTQTLDGASGYELSWSNSHTDFRIEFSVSTSDTSQSPSFDDSFLLGASTFSRTASSSLNSVTSAASETIEFNVTPSSSVSSVTSSAALANTDVSRTPSSTVGSVSSSASTDTTSTYSRSPSSTVGTVSSGVTTQPDLNYLREPSSSVGEIYTRVESLPPASVTLPDYEVEFSPSKGAFVTNWYQERSLIDTHEKEYAFYAELGDDQTYELQVEYDATGDGTVDARSEVFEVEESGIIYVAESLPGDEGWYRLLIPDNKSRYYITDIEPALTYE